MRPSTVTVVVVAVLACVLAAGAVAAGFLPGAGVRGLWLITLWAIMLGGAVSLVLARDRGRDADVFYSTMISSPSSAVARGSSGTPRMRSASWR